jgi:hypothetical protein
MSKRTLWLTDLRKRKMHKSDPDFRVVKLQNTIEWTIGDTLSEQQVQDLCNMTAQYTINVQPQK